MINYIILFVLDGIIRQQFNEILPLVGATKAPHARPSSLRGGSSYCTDLAQPVPHRVSASVFTCSDTDLARSKQLVTQHSVTQGQSVLILINYQYQHLSPNSTTQNQADPSACVSTFNDKCLVHPKPHKISIYQNLSPLSMTQGYSILILINYKNQYPSRNSPRKVQPDLSESVTTFNETKIAYPEPHQLSQSSAFTKFNDTGLARYYQLLPLHLTTKGQPILIHINYQYQSVTEPYDIVRLSILILIRYHSPAPIVSMDDTRLAYLNPHQLPHMSSHSTIGI